MNDMHNAEDMAEPIPVGSERRSRHPGDLQTVSRTRMSERVYEVSLLLKALSHESRLMILCHLADGEKSVSELENLLGMRQAAVSQQLARLRLEGLVRTRREGRGIYYGIHDPKVYKIILLLESLFLPAE